MSRKNFVIALNMQLNYFSPKGSSYLGEKSKEVKDRIIGFINSLDKSKNEVVFTKEIHSTEDSFYESQKTSCIVGTSDVIMVDNLTNDRLFIISTTRPSALFKSPLLNEIKKADPETITLVGAETNESILFTAADLRNYGYKVIVPLDKIIAKDDYLQNIGITLMADVFGVTLI